MKKFLILNIFLAMAVFVISPNNALGDQRPDWPVVDPTPSSNTLYGDVSAYQTLAIGPVVNLPVGSIIAAYVGGVTKAVGRYDVVEGDNGFWGDMSVYGDDDTTPEKDGAAVGDEIRFKFFVAKSGPNDGLICSEDEVVPTAKSPSTGSPKFAGGSAEWEGNLLCTHTIIIPPPTGDPRPEWPPVDPTPSSNTLYGNISAYQLTPSGSAINLPAGSIIAAFVNGVSKAVGRYEVMEGDNGFWGDMSVYGDDDTTSEKDGAFVGDVIEIRIFVASPSYDYGILCEESTRRAVITTATSPNTDPPTFAGGAAEWEGNLLCPSPIIKERPKNQIKVGNSRGSYGDLVTVPILIDLKTHTIDSFGFNINYPGDKLLYSGFTRGVKTINFERVKVNLSPSDPNELLVGGYTYAQGTSILKWPNIALKGIVNLEFEIICPPNVCSTMDSPWNITVGGLVDDLGFGPPQAFKETNGEMVYGCMYDGNVNRDNQISMADALMAFKGYLEKIYLGDCQKEAGDVAARSPEKILTPQDAQCIAAAYVDGTAEIGKELPCDELVPGA